MKHRASRPPRNAAPQASGSVRIVGGRWRGTKLAVLDRPGLRPTSDRVRETLFNWLAPVLPGARVLDLFAGTGALGLEALSRGAAHAVLVEHDRAIADALRATVARLQANDIAEVVQADAMAWLHAQPDGAFDVAFLDPPFDANLWGGVLPALARCLRPEAWLYVEQPVDGDVDPPAGWHLHREGRTREVRHALFRRGPAADAATLGPDLDHSNLTRPGT
jgi:16S rRNA (guanine966-N2)-methyltransferase